MGPGLWRRGVSDSFTDRLSLLLSHEADLISHQANPSVENY